MRRMMAWLMTYGVGVCSAAGADGVYFIPPAAVNQVADGDLSDWGEMSQPVVIDQDHLEGGWIDKKFDGIADCQAHLRLAYTETDLRVALWVRDNSVRPLEAPSKQPGKFWEQDGAGLYLDVPGANVASGRYHTQPSRPWTTSPLLQLTPSIENHGLAVLPDGSRYGCQIQPGGYTVEASIPWSALGWQPRIGDRLFFAAIVADIDRDAAGQDQELKQLIWRMPSEQVPAASRAWAQARLVNPGGFGGELLVAAPVVKSPAAVAWKLMADANQPGWKIEQLALANDQGVARPVANFGAAMEPGNPLMRTGQLATAGLAPGRYQLQATAVRGNQTETIQQLLTVVEAEEEEVQSTKGGIPQQYLIPDPLRSGTFTAKAHAPVDHASFRAFVDEHIRETWPSFEYHLKAQTPLGGSWYMEYGLRLAAYAKVTGDPGWIERAQQMLEMAHRQFQAHEYEGLGWINMPLMYYCKQYLEAVNAWKPEYEAMVQDWYRHVLPAFPSQKTGSGAPWYGLNNWGLSSGMQGDMGRYWLGDQWPDGEQWAQHVQDTWGEFMQKKDHDENTTNYAPWDLWLILLYLDVTEQTDLLRTDPDLRYVFERYLYEIAPCGARPQYGNTNGFHDSLAVWMYLFERVGDIVQDGRYPYTAHWIWDYALHHVEDWHQYHLVYDQTVTWLTRLLAEVPDDIVTPVPPEPESLVTTRKKPRLATSEEKAERNIYWVMTDEVVPNKLIFRSGNEPTSLWALVEMNPNAGHCSPERPTSVTCLMAAESVLLADQGYYENEPQFHNMVFLEDLEGTQGLAPEPRISVPTLAEFRCGVYAVAEVERYLRWPVTLRRHFFFIKDRFLWVRDEVNFQSGFFTRVGPCWLSRQLGPASGENWVNLYFDIMPYTGLGQGGGMHRWRNYNHDLLLYFVPRPGRELSLADLTAQNFYMNAPLQVRQAWTGLAQEGQTLWFDSLLLPHPVQYQQPDPTPFAQGIQVLASEDDQTALLAELEWRKEKVLVLQSRQPFSGANVHTDAREAVIIWQGDTVLDWFVRGATYLKVGPQTLLESAQPVDQEK